ncbi:chaperone DnaJ protein [Trypanosoma grayi]|uniref:chaperone DnaJ protein n=1 Tax=Trypanosoma grayi TaxID=71804 RepID=UPI0004F484D6|nr:chaperone DnaJ protein [Trypanosoma grayi]KEG12878.1 chaperone DnaJ protein [Trypanosoma grayi]
MFAKGAARVTAGSSLRLANAAVHPNATQRCVSSKAQCELETAPKQPCPFATLGVSKDSSMTEVKTAYRVKCQTEHPDVGGSDEGFRRINCAYEECTRCVQEREGKSGETSRSSAVKNDTGREGCKKHQQRSDDSHESLAERHREMRQMFYGAFARARTGEEIDELLLRALQSHCFDSIDVSEPLALALRHYHRVTGYGAPHLARCFAAVDRWEQYTERRAGATLYHILLVLYADSPTPGMGATAVAESVAAVLERMRAGGLEYDDWTLTLAHKAYRTSPYPT